MHVDVGELHAFYLDDRLGIIARRLVAARLRAMWPDVHGLSLAGIGFAAPYLRVFREEAARTIALMPAQQGCVRWPFDGRCLTALVDEASLPLADESVERVLLVHALETSEAYRPLLRQAWRVLAPGGKLMVVAPNRRGVWSYTETTPFGHGRPYTRGQLQRTLEGAMFSPERWEQALYGPPLRWRFTMGGGAAWERAGRRFWAGFGGVHLVEASKQVYGAMPAQPVARPVRVLAGQAA